MSAPKRIIEDIKNIDNLLTAFKNDNLLYDHVKLKATFESTDLPDSINDLNGNTINLKPDIMQRFESVEPTIKEFRAKYLELKEKKKLLTKTQNDVSDEIFRLEQIISTNNKLSDVKNRFSAPELVNDVKDFDSEIKNLNQFFNEAIKSAQAKGSSIQHREALLKKQSEAITFLNQSKDKKLKAMGDYSNNLVQEINNTSDELVKTQIYQDKVNYDIKQFQKDQSSTSTQLSSKRSKIYEARSQLTFLKQREMSLRNADIHTITRHEFINKAPETSYSETLIKIWNSAKTPEARDFFRKLILPSKDSEIRTEKHLKAALGKSITELSSIIKQLEDDETKKKEAMTTIGEDISQLQLSLKDSQTQSSELNSKHQEDLNKLHNHLSKESEFSMRTLKSEQSALFSLRWTMLKDRTKRLILKDLDGEKHLFNKFRNIAAIHEKISAFQKALQQTGDTITSLKEKQSLLKDLKTSNSDLIYLNSSLIKTIDETEKNLKDNISTMSKTLATSQKKLDNQAKILIDHHFNFQDFVKQYSSLKDAYEQLKDIYSHELFASSSQEALQKVNNTLLKLDEQYQYLTKVKETRITALTQFLEAWRSLTDKKDKDFYAVEEKLGQYALTGDERDWSELTNSAHHYRNNHPEAADKISYLLDELDLTRSDQSKLDNRFQK